MSQVLTSSGSGSALGQSFSHSSSGGSVAPMPKVGHSILGAAAWSLKNDLRGYGIALLAICIVGGILAGLYSDQVLDYSQSHLFETMGMGMGAGILLVSGLYMTFFHISVPTRITEDHIIEASLAASRKIYLQRGSYLLIACGIIFAVGIALALIYNQDFHSWGQANPKHLFGTAVAIGVIFSAIAYIYFPKGHAYWSLRFDKAIGRGIFRAGIDSSSPGTPGTPPERSYHPSSRVPSPPASEQQPPAAAQSSPQNDLSPTTPRPPQRDRTPRVKDDTTGAPLFFDENDFDHNSDDSDT